MGSCVWLSSLVQIQRICIDPRQVLSLDLYLYLIFTVFCSYSSILHYIDQQFERYLGDESGLNRRNITDNRVHACFYFISPAGHGCVSKFLYIFFNLKTSRETSCLRKSTDNHASEKMALRGPGTCPLAPWFPFKL